MNFSNSSISLNDWKSRYQPTDDKCMAANVTGLPIENIINWVLSNKTMDMMACERFEFDTSVSETTIQSEWNVVCDDATFLSVIEMCFLAGAATGSLSSGALSDEYGRRHSLMFFVALQAAIGKSFYFSNLFIPFPFLCLA